MKEEFLHYLWKYSLYDADKLLDDLGNRIIVIHPGEYNRDSGPDFFNARLKIGGTEWAGNVEIHLKSSDFDNHHHNLDPAFDNIILHVVYENDKAVFNSRGEEILTSALVFYSGLYDKYLALVNNPCIIACEGELKTLDPFYLREWLGSLVIERLQEKSDQIKAVLSGNENDWDETVYRLLTRYFGFRVNTEPFEMLASSLPFRIIRRHADNRFQIEALLYGTAGMLDEGLFREAIDDIYFRDLSKEYRILSAKYNLKPVHGWLWKFSRLRPANFPTIRISQLAALLTVSGGIFSKMVEARTINELRELFGVTASEYWDEHFVFGRKSRSFRKNTGTQAADILLVNAIIPALFVFGKYKGSEEISERALTFLEEIDPEENIIIAEWKSTGMVAESAFITQGLLQLRNCYCRKRRCLDCRIGNRLLILGRNLRREEEVMLEP